MARDIDRRYGIRLSDEQVRKMHLGQVDPATISAEHLIAVAKYYGVNSSALGEVAEQRVGNLLAMTQNWKMLRTEAIRATRRDPHTGRWAA